MPTKHRNKDMFRIIKYIILLLLVIALIYFLRVSFRNNSMEIKLKNPGKIEDLKQRTIKLKNEFDLFKKEGEQETETARERRQAPFAGAKERSRHGMDKEELDKFIREHSN